MLPSRWNPNRDQVLTSSRSTKVKTRSAPSCRANLATNALFVGLAPERKSTTRIKRFRRFGIRQSETPWLL
jgi:hypothetical protein